MRADAKTARPNPFARFSPERGALQIVLFVVFGAALLALSAKVKVPFYPVPMTLQTMVVVILAASVGSRLAVATVLLYLAEGAAGLPVFANTPPAIASLAYFAGPTGGYLAGFAVAALVVGALSDRGAARTWPTLFGAMLLGELLTLASGTVWLAFGAGFGPGKAFAVGAAPFLFGALVKAAAGTALIFGVRRIADTRTR